MWNNRVMIEPYTFEDGAVELTATVHEVYYMKEGVGYTSPISPAGTGETELAALEELKLELQLMLEAVDYAIQNKTSVFDYDNPETHNPGAPSLIMREHEAKNAVLDKDDAYMAEKYDEED